MIFLKKKKYLINSYHKLNYPKGSKLIFVDEYLYNMYTDAEKLNFNCIFINNFKKLNKLINNNNFLIKKKLLSYRKTLKIFLNQFHKKNYDLKYWGLVLDQFLINLIQSIIVEIELLKKVKLYKDSKINQRINKKYIYDLNDLFQHIVTKDYKNYLTAIILKEIGLKKTKIIFKNNNFKKKKNFKYIFYRFIFRIYINLFKPILLIDSYIGFKNCLIFFLKSFGKIVSVPKSLVIKDARLNFRFDIRSRKKIHVKEKDIVDIIFNKLIKNYFPIILLENYLLAIDDINKISKKISIIGTGNLHYYSSFFNLLTAEIKKNKGKFIVFQHGSLNSETNLLSREHVDKNYADKCYYFKNKKGLGQHYFNSIKKIHFNEIKKRNKILILNNDTSFERSIYYFRKSNHPYLENSKVFFSNLDERAKYITQIKLFPDSNCNKLKKIWVNIFNDEPKFLPYHLNAKKNNYFNSKLVILNDISTPLYELIFQNFPFILILDIQQYIEIKKNFRLNLMKLKKLKILFDSPYKASKFVNLLSCENNLEIWWNSIKKNKDYIKFKNSIINEKNNYTSLIVKNLSAI